MAIQHHHLIGVLHRVHHRTHRRSYTPSERVHHHHHRRIGTGHRRLNSYQHFMAQHLRIGMTMAKVAALWRSDTGRPRTTHRRVLHHRRALSY